MRFFIGQYFKGQIVKAVTGQNRRRLIKSLVDRRLTPAHVIIIHRRKIVMHQRVNMDAFDSQPDTKQRILGDVEQLARRLHQQGTQSLAAAYGRMAHGLI